MKKLLSFLYLLLAPLLAVAQQAPAEAPVEHASAATVVIFFVLFLGSIVGYGVYLWWRAKATKQLEKK